MIRLSKRLTALAGLCKQCDVIADIGCDHGLLSAYLLESGLADKVIAADVNEGPLSKASKLLGERWSEDKWEARLSDGGRCLTAGEADGAVIAGMGGMLILRILSDSLPVFSTMEYLVLGAQSDLPALRSRLSEYGFESDGEDLVFEDGKYYQLLRVRHTGRKNRPDERYLHYGNLYSHALYSGYMEYERGRIGRALEALEDGKDTEENRLRREELIKELSLTDTSCRR